MLDLRKTFFLCGPNINEHFNRVMSKLELKKYNDSEISLTVTIASPPADSEAAEWR